MPIWGEVELFCRAIFEEGLKEADAMVTQAKAESERTVTEARQRAEKQFQEHMLTERGKAALEAKRLVDSAELEAKKRVIAVREEIALEVLTALEAHLKVISEQPGYVDFLVSAIAEGISALQGKEFVVELNKEHLTLVKDKVEAMERERSLKIALKASPSVEGGVRIYTADQRLLYDNTLKARLKRREDEIRREIWRRMFGTESSNA